MSKGICSGCRQTFNSESVFNMHRYGGYGEPIYSPKQQIIGYSPSERQCLTDIQMWTKGLMKNQKGWWVTSLYDESIHKQEGETDVWEESLADPA